MLVLPAQDDRAKVAHLEMPPVTGAYPAELFFFCTRLPEVEVQRFDASPKRQKKKAEANDVRLLGGPERADCRRRRRRVVWCMGCEPRVVRCEKRADARQPVLWSIC